MREIPPGALWQCTITNYGWMMNTQFQFDIISRDKGKAFFHYIIKALSHTCIYLCPPHANPPSKFVEVQKSSVVISYMALRVFQVTPRVLQVAHRGCQGGASRAVPGWQPSWVIVGIVPWRANISKCLKCSARVYSPPLLQDSPANEVGTGPD